MPTASAETIQEAVQTLSADLKRAATTMSADEARFLVDAYYIHQEGRKRADNQIRALGENYEPHSIIRWLTDNEGKLERVIRQALDAYSRQSATGVWARSITGIGPVITAGLLAHIDIEKAPTVGHIWRFAGLDPTDTWGKGEKRPWNAALKTLCWHIGESIVKQQNRHTAGATVGGEFYGQLYAERKALETERSEKGLLKDQADVGAKRVGKSTEAYKWYAQGKLPPGHIHARAKRYAVKLFLAHLHHVLYETRYGTPPPKPYILTQPGHAHFIKPPSWPLP